MRTGDVGGSAAQGQLVHHLERAVGIGTDVEPPAGEGRGGRAG
jgi:hypothetical protein